MKTKLLLLALAIISSANISAQIKAMAAPTNIKAAIKHTFPTKPSAKDSTNIYENMLNDESDDLMENHPAEDIYNSVWVNEHVNPYSVSINDLPDSVKINCNGFVMPINGRVTSKFGPRRYRFHYGIDLSLHVGDSVRAAFSGKVRLVDYDRGGYGNFVVIRHANGLETVYAHLSKVEVKPDQTVKAGQIIALGGNTGRSTGPHLHFETRYVGNAINPANIINFEDGRVLASTFILTKKNFYYQYRSDTKAIAKYVKVRKGDNLSTIAQRNGISVSTLKRLNGIKGTDIKAGKRLKVR